MLCGNVCNAISSRLFWQFSAAHDSVQSTKVRPPLCLKVICKHAHGCASFFGANLRWNEATPEGLNRCLVCMAPKTVFCSRLGTHTKPCHGFGSGSSSLGACASSRCCSGSAATPSACTGRTGGRASALALFPFLPMQQFLLPLNPSNKPARFDFCFILLLHGAKVLVRLAGTFAKWMMSRPT